MSCGALVVREDASRNALDWPVPSEINERIVRHLSKRPHFRYAQNFVHAKDVLGVLGASEQLRDAARNIFRRLIFLNENGDERYFYLKKIPYDPKQYPPGLLFADPALFELLLAALGGALQFLSIQNVHLCGSSRSWLDLLRRNVSSITELVLHAVDEQFPLEDVLDACSTIKRLNVGFAEHAPPALLESVLVHAS